jgi:serine/threonine-protein kinase
MSDSDHNRPPSAPATPPGPPRPAARGTAILGAAPAPPPVSAPSPSSANIIPPRPPMPSVQEVHASPAAARVSDPELRKVVDALAETVGHVDPESSIEIPPPPVVERDDDRPPDAKDPYIGTTFDHRYKIEKLLGEGGMGFVYLARHKVIDKKVAVKVLRSDMARDREILDRFLQEAKSASSIGNPHIVDISDFGDLPDGSTYFVMEYLEGQSLTQAMDATQRFEVERLCTIAMAICDGLEAAHQAGIVHRDLKPDNIFLVPRGGENDFVKILDFGIAKVSKQGNTKLTRAGAVFGTPHYMSPEQAAGAQVDHRTDIYSLGVILYEMTSGQLPFNADNFMGILTQHMYKAPVPIRALVPAPDCPPGLEALILKCLSKKPESRYASMKELAADLGRLKRGEVPLAVHEMMARSGGFNVPHDFFKPQQKAIMPATPLQQRRPWPRYVWIAGALSAVGLVTAIIVKSATGQAGTEDKPAAAPTIAATAAPAPTVAPSAAPEVKTSMVALAAVPESALAYRDGQELKLPATIEVEDGKSVHVEIKAEGFETASLDLDGKEPSKLVKLTPVKTTTKAVVHGPRVPSTKSGGTGTKHSGGGEVIDPWK